MPTKSPKQARTMRAAAHDQEFAKKVGIPQDVAKEFVEADKQAKEKEKKKAEEDKKKHDAKHHAKASITTKYKKEA
jgi:uncharacterized membrane protein